MADPTELTFRGSSPEECEDFVSAIRKRAFAEGKHRDNEWIAFLASSCFTREALYWYEGLDAEVQEDWSRLRPALLERFGKKDAPSSTTSSESSTPMTPSSSSIPTPAAAPPTSGGSLSRRKGILKIVATDDDIKYLPTIMPNYISPRYSEDGIYSWFSFSKPGARNVASSENR